MVSPIRGLNDSSVDTAHPADVRLTQRQVNAAEAAEMRLLRDKVEEKTGISILAESVTLKLPLSPHLGIHADGRVFRGLRAGEPVANGACSAAQDAKLRFNRGDNRGIPFGCGPQVEMRAKRENLHDEVLPRAAGGFTTPLYPSGTSGVVL